MSEEMTEGLSQLLLLLLGLLLLFGLLLLLLGLLLLLLGLLLLAQRRLSMGDLMSKTRRRTNEDTQVRTQQ